MIHNGLGSLEKWKLTACRARSQRTSENTKQNPGYDWKLKILGTSGEKNWGKQ